MSRVAGAVDRPPQLDYPRIIQRQAERGRMGDKAIARIIGELRQRPSRNWSIVVTMFGDAILPRGGSVWLGTLLDFFGLIDIGEGAVRTAMSRLAADGWLERSREGRNSFYRLTARGEETFVVATQLIYGVGGPGWDGAFDALFVERDWTEQRDARRARLEQAGYGLAAPGVLIAPPGHRPDAEAAEGAIALKLTGEAEACRRLAALAWPVAESAVAYRRFLASFSPLDEAVAGGAGLTEAQAIVARILLVHEYRRLVLRYPQLPPELLPPDWPGETARGLCRRLYHSILPAAEAWLDLHGRSLEGPLPAPDPAIHARFGA